MRALHVSGGRSVSVMSSELFAEKLKQWVSNQPNDSNRYVTDEEHAEMVKKLLKFSKEEEKPSSSKEYR